MRWLPRLILSLCIVAPLAGCAGSEGAVEVEEPWDVGALRDHIGQLTEPVVPYDSTQVARRTTYAARRMAAARMMPARAPSFLFRMRGADSTGKPWGRPGPTQAHVLGYVPGRHPSHHDELVIVAADIDSPEASAVLAVARRLAEHARFEQVPERTVLFALWSPPRTGALGLADFLANPTWALPGVTRVLLTTEGRTAAAESQRMLDASNIPSDVVSVRDQSVAIEGADPDIEEARTLARVVRLADALYTQTLAAATARDSTVANP